MNKKICTFVFALILSIGVMKAEFSYSSTLLDFNDTLGGVVQGTAGVAWQNSPHGVAVAPDGNVWINIYGGKGRREILASGDTVHYKGIYVLDPATGDHVSFSPIEILTFPDGTSDSLTAESASSGGGRGIEVDQDGHILSSHYKTLYKINYMTGEGVAMWVGESSLTEAVTDANGNVYVSYVIAGERPCVVLDGDLAYVGNAIDTVGFINRAIEVTSDGEDMFLGSTWNGIGVTHWNSTVPGVVAHEIADTFGVFDSIPACWEEISSAMGTDSAFVAWCALEEDFLGDDDFDTIFVETALWASSLDFDPDEEFLIVGALTAGWGGPLGGTYWAFDDDMEVVAQIGNWHDWDGSGEGVTDGPRGAAFDSDGNVYLADFYSHGIYHYAYEEEEDLEDPFSYSSTLLDFNDTLGGVVQGTAGVAWQNSPHGVAVAPDGNVWINIYGGKGRREILASGDTVHYKGIYVLDPATGDHVSFSPIEILTFPDGTSDSLTAESASSGGGRGIEVDQDGHILSSHYKTLYKINYMTGEGVAMWVGESSLTEAVTDANGNVYVSYVIAGERPCVVLDGDLAYVGNAIDTVGFINRAIEVTSDGEDMFLGSTWNGIGVTHWNSTVPGVVAHEIADTFGVFDSIPACWEEISSAMGTDSAFVAWCALEEDFLGDDDFDTIFVETALWASSLDFDPDEEFLIVGALTAGWGGPLGGTYWAFDDDMEVVAQIGNWHDWDGSGEGVTDGPRGAAFDADGNLYLADFYSHGIYHYAEDYSFVDKDRLTVLPDRYVLKQNYPNPFNPATSIEFSIPVSENVNLSIYNIEGRLVKTLVNQKMMSGQHVIEWNGTNQIGSKVASGMYIYQLKTNKKVLNRTMTFIK